MQLASREAIDLLCRQYAFYPSRSSGQNFLICPDALERIVSAARLKADDTILEIGAGFGTLTVELVKKANKVVAIELDKRLAVALRKLSIVDNRLEVVEGDVFSRWSVISNHFGDLQYKLVSNLPYNITSLVLRQFTEQLPRPSGMVVLVQKEVGERVTARPPHMSILSLAIQLYGDPSIVDIIPRKCFYPEPKVDSCILHIASIGQDTHGYLQQLGLDRLKKFFQLVKIGFSAKRKQLHNNLSAGWRVPDKEVSDWLESQGVKPSIRAQELGISDWVSLTINLPQGWRGKS